MLEVWDDGLCWEIVRGRMILLARWKGLNGWGLCYGFSVPWSVSSLTNWRQQVLRNDLKYICLIISYLCFEFCFRKLVSEDTDHGRRQLLFVWLLMENTNKSENLLCPKVKSVILNLTQLLGFYKICFKVF